MIFGADAAPFTASCAADLAALAAADLPAAEWPMVHIVHDAHIFHDVQRSGWHAAGMTPRVTDVDRAATAAEPPQAAQLSAGQLARLQKVLLT